MNRLLTLCVSTCLVAAAQPKPAFDVVSIKPAPRPTPEGVRAGTTRVGITIEPPRVEFVGYGLNVLLARAFQVEVQQIDLRGLGGAEFFEVQAKMPEGSTPAQVPAMLQSMLEDRFKLAYHRETRDYSTTVVTVGKNGMKLPRLPDDTPHRSSTDRLANGAARMTTIGTLRELFPVMNSFGGFAQMVDQTGLEGVYAWVQELQPATPGRTFQDIEREAFEAMFDAAGLNLDVRKTPRETIVVDRIEKLPTEN